MGGVLFRVQGLSTLRRVQAHLDAKEMPVGDLLSGVGILLAALLLFIPGFVTDALGFLLFIPPLRKILMIGLLAQAMKGGTRINVGGFGRRGAPPPGGMRRGPDGKPVIDGDFEDLTDGPKPQPADGSTGQSLPSSDTDIRKP